MNTVADIAMNREWNGRKIRIRPEDRYVCLTDMAASVKKRFSHWWESNDAQDYVEKLSKKTGIPVLRLVEVKTGRGNVTWGHPKVALRFAQWCSNDFAIQVDEWVDELLTTGMVKITESPKESAWLLDDILLRKPVRGDIMFLPEWREWATKTSGYAWNMSNMGKFINNTVYDYMSPDITEKLKERCPRTGERGRAGKFYHLLTEEAREVVSKHLDRVLFLMKAANGNLDLFEAMMANAFGGYRSIKDNPDQLELFTAQTVFVLKPAA